jgi:N-acyl homoserine lactone hydrolase
MKVHVIPTGRLTGNKTFLRGEGWSSVFRKAEFLEFPAYVYVLEHPDGLIAIDTGMTSRVKTPRVARRMVPTPHVEPDEEIGPQMRKAGLDPADVRLVVLTHLDWDHAGGLAHFPYAKVLVHRPEFEFSKKFMGKMRYKPKVWPKDFTPELYDLDPEPLGPFPESKAVTEKGDVRLVPIPGHSIAQVGVTVRDRNATLFFGADHMLSQDWFLEDYAAGRLIQLGIFYKEKAAETSRRIHEFLGQQPTVLLPAHDAEAVARVAALRPVNV